MVTDEQVRLLMKGIQREKSLTVAAAKAGMSEKTARRYRDLEKPPSEVRPLHDWRTRRDPFEKVGRRSAPIWNSSHGWKRELCSTPYSASTRGTSRTDSCGRCNAG